VGLSGHSTNKTDSHDIHVTEILLKVALNAIKQTNKQCIHLPNSFVVKDVLS
jgi:hypothetical protein